MKMIYKIISFAALFLVIPNIFSQATQEWAVRYFLPGNGVDNAKAMVLDAAGNIYVTGESYSSEGNSDFATVKYNSAGDQQWVARYNGPGNYIDYAVSIAVDASGNVFVSGYSTGINTDYDFTTIKYSSSGIQLWVQRYSSSGNLGDQVKSMAIDAAGNIYITGSSYETGESSNFTTIKYNSAGTQIWLQSYNGPGNNSEIPFDITVDNSGNVFITGSSTGSGTSLDYCTIKYNSSGILQWIQRYNGTGNYIDQSYSIAVDPQGDVYVTGTSRETVSGSDCTTIKYSSNGAQLWIQKYSGPGNLNDQAYSLALDQAGNVIITGSCIDLQNNMNYVTVKYNSNGIQQWAQSYMGSGNGNDIAYDIDVDIYGNAYVTGNITVTGASFDYATVKYNSSGVQQWVQTYNGPGNGNDIARSIAVDVFGNVYVTGQSTGSGTNYDYSTIKYSQPIAINQISSEVPKGFSLNQNYPNPFNPVTYIEFSITMPSNVKLAVYDMTGREINVLVNQNLNAGVYKADWDAAGYSSGVYFYRITAGNYTEVKKMMLVK